MSRYRIARVARTDLKEICHYIAQDKPSAARRLRKIFTKTFQLLAAQPLIGESCEEYGKNLRRLTEGNYVIFYRPAPGGIEVVRVIHGARDIDELFW